MGWSLGKNRRAMISSLSFIEYLRTKRCELKYVKVFQYTLLQIEFYQSYLVTLPVWRCYAWYLMSYIKFFNKTTSGLLIKFI